MGWIRTGSAISGDVNARTVGRLGGPAARAHTGRAASASLVAAAPEPHAPLLRRLFGIAPEETSLARRGFRCEDPHVRERLEGVGLAFLRGYHGALEHDGDAAGLGARLDADPAETLGFAYEGAGMGLMLSARLMPWRYRHWRDFLAGPGARHVYLVHVGAGWALAALPWGHARALRRLDPLLGFLAFDGFGFHHGYFNPRRHVEGQHVPRRLHGYARRVFDQGLGRALWFVEGADPARVSARVAGFPLPRRADLWSGVGLACTYAGGADDRSLQALRTAGAAFALDLAQGAAFAAEARHRAGNLTAHTQRACRVLCGVSAEAAAQVAREALDGLPARASAGEGAQAYEQWRWRIRTHFAQGAATSQGGTDE